MRHLETYWKKNKEWWEYKIINGTPFPVIKDTAPLEAKKSYKVFREQIKEK